MKYGVFTKNIKSTLKELNTGTHYAVFNSFRVVLYFD
jgi:hypothetical protein